MSSYQNMIKTGSSQESDKEVLQVGDVICYNNLSYLNSMALKCAVHLGIADAIQKHGNKPITVKELATSLDIHPSKISSLPRLMRLLCHNNFFSKHDLPNGEIGYSLTQNSNLLLNDHPHSQVPIFLAFTNQVMTTEPAHHLHSWFKSSVQTPFEIAHGRTLWEYASCNPEFSEMFNKSMATESILVSSILTGANSEVGGIFEGVKSYVDVGGGNGTMAKSLAQAYPDMECVVLDLPHVVNELQGNGRNLTYVAGDMFKEIPQTQVVLLKSILHNWSNEHCLTILERCKEAIPTKDKGGKVIIIDMVMDEKQNAQNQKLQIIFDLHLMSVTGGGKQRSEEEWKILFLTAGFNEYKIYNVLESSLRSVIAISYS